jgi:DNA primase
MAVIPDNVLEDIKSRCDIVEIIGGYVQLRRAGSSFKACCPFHKEKTPSFHVNPQRQIFHCFGCGAGGNVFRFLMQYEGVDFITAVRMLARRAGVALQFDEERGPERRDKDALYALHEALAEFYAQALSADHASSAEAREYLARRDLAGDAARSWRLGFAPDSAEVLLAWAKQKKFTPELLEKGGILVRKDRGGWYDRFRRRIMIPIADELGRTIGFSGRILRAEDSPAKYVNSPETPLFQKSRVVFALDRARRAMVDRRQAILCEGQFDTMRCHLAGIENAVAAQGTAVTPDHARRLKRYADEIVLVLDPDAAGQNAAMRAAALFLAEGLAVRVASIPAGEDPDTLIRRDGAGAFLACVENAVSAVQYQISVLLPREAKAGEAGIRRVAEAVLQTVGHVSGAVQRDQLIRQAAAGLHLTEEALRSDLRRVQRGMPAPSARSEPDAEGETSASEPPADEATLAELLLAHPEQTGLVRTYLPLECLQDDTCRKVLGSILRHAGEGHWKPSESEMADDRFARLAARISVAPREVIGSDFSPEDTVRRLILSLWKREMQRRRETLQRRIETAAQPMDLEMERQELTMKIKVLERGWEAASILLES